MRKTTLTRIALLLAVALTAITLAAPVAQAIDRRFTPKQKSALAPGDEFPVIGGFNLENNFVKVDWSAGQYTLVQFWAPWSEPAVAQMPVIQEIHQEYGEAGLQVVSVVRDKITLSEITRYRSEAGSTHPAMLLDEKQREQLRELVGFPVCYLVDSSGKILRKYLGHSEEIGESLKRDAESLMSGGGLGTFVFPKRQDYVTIEEWVRRRRARFQPTPQQR